MQDVGSLGAEAAALAATVVSVAAAVPQLHRIIRRRERLGVSVTSAALGVGTELTWVAYASTSGLWSALPEAAAMATVDAALLIAQTRQGAAARSAMIAGAMWTLTLVAVGAVGGMGALAAVLGVGYLVQVAPAVWTAWTTTTPSGVPAATWTMVGFEGLLWGAYGTHHADPATTGFAVVAVAAATAMLVRKVTVARRGAARRRAIGTWSSAPTPAVASVGTA
jgi:hypothetical protein